MKKQTQKAETKTAYGQTLPSPITFDFSWDEYENGAELTTANDVLTVDEQVKVRNVERKTKARQAALTAALDAAGVIKPTIENDEQVRLATMTKVLVAAGRSEDAARAEAAEILGIEL